MNVINIKMICGSNCKLSRRFYYLMKTLKIVSSRESNSVRPSMPCRDEFERATLQLNVPGMISCQDHRPINVVFIYIKMFELMFNR